MTRFLLIAIFFALLTLIYGVMVWLDIPLLQQPDQVLKEPSLSTFGLSLILLAADTFLPTPSSLVLLADGYIFGMFKGTVIGVLGLMIGNALGFLAARYGNQWLEKKFPSEKRGSSQKFLDRWGFLALAISRPVPVLAESILLLTGTTKMTFWNAMFSCFVGTVPFVLFYVAVGKYAMVQASWLTTLSLVALILAIGVSLGLLAKKGLGAVVEESAVEQGQD
ncbi:MAG: VTT domain-containing protein [Bacteroidia bacterium]